jgi:hypothetical protein
LLKGGKAWNARYKYDEPSTRISALQGDSFIDLGAVGFFSAGLSGAGYTLPDACGAVLAAPFGNFDPLSRGRIHLLAKGNIMRWSVALFALLSSPPLLAQETPPPVPAELLEPPPIPASVKSGEPLEPEITIIERKRETVEEYRLHGRLYMVKIVPRRGPEYYLVDTDGDGELETRFDDLAPDFVIPQWVLFRW